MVTDPSRVHSYFGNVVLSRFDADEGHGGTFVVRSPLWDSVPAEGWHVEVRLLYRSPYWSLVEEDAG